jgi:hypothetical protein
MTHRVVVALVSALLVLPGLVQSREVFVDQKHPAAADTNDGSEGRPLKSISPSLKLVKPGDVIWVKGGHYEETLLVETSGTANHPITLSAWKDDPVRIGSILRDVPPSGAWTPVGKTRSWSVQLPPGQPGDLTVLLDGKPIVTEFKDTPPLDDDINWATFREKDNTLMVNAGGANPAGTHKVQLARAMFGIRLTEDYGFWQFKKLEFAFLYAGVTFNGHNSLLEDCYFHDTFREGIFPHGRLLTIRRCNFDRCGYCIGASGSGPANIIEECLFVNNGMNGWEDDIRHRQMRYKEGLGPLCFKGDAYGQIFRHNIVADSTGGLWYDGSATGARIIGNAFWDNKYGSGIYNEYSADDTVTIGNYFLHATWTSSWCTRVNVLDNFFEGAGITWHNRDLWPLRYSFMTARGNAFIDVPNGYLQHFGAGWGPADTPEGFVNCLVDWNHVRFRKDSPLLIDGKERIRDLKVIQDQYGWEKHGDIKEFNPGTNDLTPESLGATTVTLRMPWGKKTHLSRPMLADGRIEGRWPAAPQSTSTAGTPSFFWKIADGDLNDSTLNPYESWFPFESRWQAHSPAGYGLGENNGCQWFIGAEEKYFKPMGKIENELSVSERSSGNHYLVMRGMTPAKIPAQGVGYWTPALATIEGARIRVTMKIRGKDLAPTEKGSAAIWVQFSNQTGQNRQRVFMLGRGDDGRMARAAFTKGSFDWKTIEDTITAPKGAIRMSLFMGVLPTKGEIAFDDIEIKTEPGVIPSLAREQEILPPRLPLERIREFHPVDLAPVANRSLVEDDENNGKGGWSDQGRDADMKTFPAGRQKFGGVEFNILKAPKAVVVLKSTNRQAGDLPASVKIPVGRKLDTLFFLHACAWTPDADKEAFRYVVHFKDGKTETLIVTGGNVADWIADPVQRFPKEERTFTTVARTVPVERYNQGSVYRMEWNLATELRTVEIESIEFVGNGVSIPILLGITGVTEY